ncbi:MAG: transposase [Candidatus Stahlbacteria bacterium]|nr:transposase [Candidatus Stahlbacteria bacterium]
MREETIDKKQRKIIRLKEYDYSQVGYYFVTICTKDRELYFENKELREVAHEFWLEIPRHFQNVKLDERVIMPNHLHGIIIIENVNVGTDYNLSLQKQNKFQNVIPKSLSYIIAGYKSAVTRDIHKNPNIPFFAWQPRYYEHIIRDEESLNKIREYIIENPLKWDLDAENPDNWKYGKKIDPNKYYKHIYDVQQIRTR